MRPAVRLRLTALVPVLALAAACADRPSGEPSAEAGQPQSAVRASLSTATALGVANVGEPIPHLLTAGQITQAQMDALAEAGYGNFVSLRLPGENGAGWEEGHAAERGLSFARVAVSGADGLTRENVEALDRILDAAGDEPTVLYCGSSNRVGAMLALRAHWLDGLSGEDAIALGRAAGMTGLEPAVARLLGLPAGTP